MVYCRKPSKACAECRAKRTRCNEALPTCGQCVRAGRQCSGYRDPLNMMFKDQNKKLTRKTTKSSATTDPNTVSLPLQKVSKILFEHCPDLQSEFYFSPPWEDQVTSFVFHNYVSEDNESCASRGFLEYLPALYRKSPPGGILADAVVALGLMGIANSNRDSALLSKAALKYSATARAVSTRLGKVDLAKEDDILHSVSLLGLFDANASDRPRSMASWLQHMKGTLSLLKLRGNKQLETHIGRRIFVQMRHNVMTSCFVLRIPVPQEILDWTVVSIQHEPTQQAASSALTFAVVRFSQLRANIGDPPNFEDSHSVVADALEIEEMLQEWAISVSSTLPWTSIPIWQPDEEVFADYYDVYAEIFTAATWNSFRSIRIMLHEILIENLVALCSSPKFITANEETFFSHKAQIFASKTLIKDLTHEVCASVPFYFNYHKRDLDGFGERPSVKAMAGYLLMWPLYTTAVAGRVSVQMREWIAGRLAKVGEVMGVGHARALGLLVGEKREVNGLEMRMEEEEDWEGYTKDSWAVDYDAYCDSPMTSY